MKPDFPVGRLVLVSARAQSEKSRDANDEIVAYDTTGVTGVGTATPTTFVLSCCHLLCLAEDGAEIELVELRGPHLFQAETQ